MTRRHPAVLVLVVALAAAGCGKGQSSDAGSPTGDTLKIGAALSLTGSLAKEGQLTKQGYQLCEEIVNSKGGVSAGGKSYKLAIAYRDDTSEPDTAAQLVDRFNDQAIKLVLGPYGSPSTEAAAAVVEKNGQVMVDSSGADNNIFTKGYRQTFAVLSPATSYAKVMIQALASQAKPKPRTVVFLSADDGFSKTVAKGGAEEAHKQGIKVLATETFPEKSTDVSAAVNKAKSLNPDLVVGAVHLVEGIAIIKQSKELGLKPAGGFAETVAPPTPDFVRTLGASAEGVVGSTQWVPQVTGEDKFFGTAQEYASSFKKRFGSDAEYHSAEAAAACLALVLGTENAGSTEPAKVRDAIARLDSPSFFGPIKFDSTGKNVTKQMSVIQIQDGKPVTVFPTDQQQSALKWPAQ
ncbi:MAG TPA: amino acid ABC transporter substrate-binding protein [Solirubrobacteraceae bacterium]